MVVLIFVPCEDYFMQILPTENIDIARVSCGTPLVIDSLRRCSTTNAPKHTTKLIERSASLVSTLSAPLHFLELMLADRRGKPISLFYYMKSCAKVSGHIWNFRDFYWEHKEELHCSRDTYFKYLRTLNELKLVMPDEQKYISGKLKGKPMGLRLAGDKTIKRLYPIDSKRKYITIKLINNENLLDQIERIVIDRNLVKQERKIKTRHHTPLMRNITKTMGGVSTTYFSDPTWETNMTCENVAINLGYKSPMTGYRREKKWNDAGYLCKYRRSIRIGHISDTLTRTKMKENGYFYMTKNGFVWQRLSNFIGFNDSYFAKPKHQNKEFNFFDYW